MAELLDKDRCPLCGNTEHFDPSYVICLSCGYDPHDNAEEWLKQLIERSYELEDEENCPNCGNTEHYKADYEICRACGYDNF